MSTIALTTSRIETRSLADTALKAAAKFWFVVAVAGQWAFFYYISRFYGSSTLQGNFQLWTRNKMLIKGYVPGDTAGNLAFAAHALLAGIIAFGGALQLVPQIRARALAVHRWNGRLFVITALAVSVTGLYMVWIRGTMDDLWGAVCVSLDGALIILFTVLAWRTAVKRRVADHRRWALRTYIVANGQWFTRVGIFAWAIASHGYHMSAFFQVWELCSTLLPLAVLELYLRARDGVRGERFAMAAALVLVTLLMALGVFGTVMFMWRPVLARL